MKRRIFETLEKIERKCVLCLMLAGFTAINTGFSPQEEEIVEEPIAMEETSATEPTAIAVGENGRLTVDAEDEMTRALSEVVEKALDPNDPFDVPPPIEEPVEEIAEYSRDYSQDYSPYAYAIDMEATAYLPSDGGGSGITALGIPATYGIVAVDPYVIPLGSRVYIPGYGEALAADTGGAIYGNRIDLCMESYWEAMDFGRRYVTVFVLK